MAHPEPKPQATGVAASTLTDPRWDLLVSRDASAAGFVYAVRTTGVFCRPGCASRLPRPENVEFFSTAGEASQAGFRPCKRCRPDQATEPPHTAGAIADLCRWIESALASGAAEPSLEDMAERAGVSPFHLHRVFRAATGLTPKQYVAFHRRRSTESQLRSQPTVTDAIYSSGYNSSSRFYTDARRTLGMTPTAFRRGGNGDTLQFAIEASSLGKVLVAGTERGVCCILLGEDSATLEHDLQQRFRQATLAPGDSAFHALVKRVVELAEHPAAAADLPLDIRGTAFQQRVWQALREIPAGSTASYSEIAERLGAPRSARAVAQACAANALAIAVPCHRVVRSDGSLSGYRWGVDRKRELLQRESAGKR